MAVPPENPRFSAPMGMLVAGSEIAGFAVMGLVIDSLTGMLNTFPWATIVFAPFGLVVALWHLSRMIRPPAKL